MSKAIDIFNLTVIFITPLVLSITKFGENLMPQDVIAQRIQRRFRSHPYRSLRCLSATVSEGIITLTGSVPNFYHRQLAIAAAQVHTPHFVDLITVA